VVLSQQIKILYVSLDLRLNFVKGWDVQVIEVVADLSLGLVEPLLGLGVKHIEPKSSSCSQDC